MWIVSGAVDIFLGAEFPIHQERGLDLRRGRACDADVGVAPDSSADAFGIARGDVHSARVSHLAVDDHCLAVIPVVGRRGEDGQYDWHESLDLDPVLSQPSVEFRPGQVRRRIVDDPDFDPSLGQSDQCFAQAPSDLVVFENIELYVDVVPGSGKVSEKVSEHVVELGVDLDVVVPQGQGLVGHPEQGCDVRMSVRKFPPDRVFIGCHDLVLPFRNPGVLYQAGFFLVCAEHIVKHQTETRQEAQDEYPCESRYGMPVLGDQHDDDADQCQDCHYLYKCFHPESFCFCNILNIRK